MYVSFAGPGFGVNDIPVRAHQPANWLSCVKLSSPFADVDHDVGASEFLGVSTSFVFRVFFFQAPLNNQSSI